MKNFAVKFFSAAILSNKVALCIFLFTAYCLLPIAYCLLSTASLAQSPQSRLWSVPPHQIRFPSLAVSPLPTPALNTGYEYQGQFSQFAHNVMHDIQGNLLFFIVDGWVYDKQGLAIGEIISPTTRVTGTTEWLIVPVPGNCKQWYLIGGKYENQTTIGGFPRPYYITLDLSLPNSFYGPPVQGDFTSPTAIFLNNGFTGMSNIPGANQKNGCLHFAVTPPRPNGERFLYINYWYNGLISRFRITSTGIVYDNYTIFLPSSAISAVIRAEMELVQLPGINSHYRLAVPYLSNNIITIFVADADFNTGDLIVGSEKLLALPPQADVHGLEFSADGRFLYVAHTNPNPAGPFLQYADLNVVTPAFSPLAGIVNPNITPTQEPNFQLTQIELGNDGKLYFGSANGMASLDIGANFPSPSGSPVGKTWINTVVGPSGPLPGVPVSTAIFPSKPETQIRLLNEPKFFS